MLGQGEALPFPDGAFGLVTAFGVLEHIEDDAGAVREWARVLRPGGQLVLLTSAYRWMWSGHDVSNHHVRRYRRHKVGDLVRRAGLEPQRVSYANAALFHPISRGPWNGYATATVGSTHARTRQRCRAS